MTFRVLIGFCSRYFSQIDEDLLQQILEIYQLDFDLFDYDSSKYAKMVQKKGEKHLPNINNQLDFGEQGSHDDKTESKAFS
jgi:Sulfotransferase family